MEGLSVCYVDPNDANAIPGIWYLHKFDKARFQGEIKATKIPTTENLIASVCTRASWERKYSEKKHYKFDNI